MRWAEKIFGAEVLIRWAHGITGERNLIPPDYFIAIAEESGIIIDIGAWVMRKACFQLKQWLDEGYALQQISVNVFGASI
ncbi:EAL domain-containing protein [Methylocucumis oryzae]|uniref:EAL domain-containing protein n=1 Tax=Methylocucumis oryzae TaxID=1632867 RepID=UPI0009E3D72E|nr:EAL domain-containing protein [Methylocucumis oryzae]